MKEKELYTSPVIKVVEVKMTGVIATSAPEFGDGGEIG